MFISELDCKIAEDNSTTCEYEKFSTGYDSLEKVSVEFIANWTVEGHLYLETKKFPPQTYEYKTIAETGELNTEFIIWLYSPDP